MKNNLFNLEDIPDEILSVLLCDRSTGKNIKWCTDNYNCDAESEMTLDAIRSCIPPIIPRVLKEKEDKKKRTKKRAEVFTPSWVCKEMNNACIKEWFKNEGYTKTDYNYKKYIRTTILEITCGEAPYLVSRYDTVSGERIRLNSRNGMLDKKIRVINKWCISNRTPSWYKWVTEAYKHTYGYEYQGDNLFIARINLFLTFIEFYENKYLKKPDINKQKEIAEIISWNIWQMDGLNYMVPNTDVPAKIFDWDENKEIEFSSFFRKGEEYEQLCIE